MPAKLIDFFKGYKIRNQEDGVPEILIYEEIGENWFGGISAKQFAKDLKDLGEIDALTLRINSPGGDVFDGNTIYNLLKSHKAEKTVHIDGLAASIASVIAMAGDNIYMADNAMMMIHPAWGLVMGNADDMRKAADLLDKIDRSILRTYQKRTGMAEDELRDMLLAETWMSAEEALENNFIDEITDPLEMAAHCDLSRFKYRNIPDQLKPEAEKPKAPRGNFRERLAHMSLAAQKIRVASNSKR